MIKKLFAGTDLFKNISTLVVGTFLAQLVPMLLQAWLRRIYPAADYGVYEIYISITGILMVVASLRYEMAVVLPEKRKDAINLVFSGIFIAIVFSIILLAVVVIFKYPILEFLNLDQGYAFMLYFLPPSIFLFSSYQVINYYLVRSKSFRAISLNKISRRTSEGAVQAGFGAAAVQSTGLLWGSMAGHIINVLAGIRQMFRAGFTARLFSFKRQWLLMKRYREFPLYNTFPALFNALCMHLPVILVTRFYSTETVAHFGLTKQVLVLPASILALSISQVLLQNLSEKYNQKLSFKSDLLRVIAILTLLAAAMTAMIALWAPYLFSLYAGEEYYISGVYARILVAGAALKLIASPVSSIFIALKKIKTLSLWQAFYFLGILSLFFFQDTDIITFLKIYLAIDLIAYGVFLFLIVRLSNSYEKSLKNKIK